MVKLHFENTHEFERLFKNKDEKVTDAIVLAIQEAIKFQKKTAYLFEISFEDADMNYEISLPSSQWETALNECLKHYETLDSADKAIDTYLLRKEVLQWLS